MISELPLGGVWLTSDGKEITGCAGQNLKEQWASKFTKEYFAENYILLEERFDLVW